MSYEGRRTPDIRKGIQKGRVTEKEEITSTEPTEVGTPSLQKKSPAPQWGKKYSKTFLKKYRRPGYQGRRTSDTRKGRQKGRVTESDRKRETTSTEPQEGRNTIYTKDPQHPH